MDTPCTVLRPKEVAPRVGMHEDTVRRRIRLGTFPGYRYGTDYFIPMAWLALWETGRNWKAEGEWQWDETEEAA